MARTSLWLLLCACLSQVSWAATVRKSLRLTWGEGAPNGRPREMIFINGQFPGPNLIFDEDDDVEITVHNDMPRNATVHWHGIAQTGTPWSDGVIGLSQRPILPGESFVYRFKASPPGTHWYHSHERMSLEDGLYGAIFVRPKQNLKGLWSQISNNTKDIKAMEKAARNPKLMVLSEWTSFTSEAWWKAVQESGLLIFCVDSILLNGQGEAYCPPHEFLINQTNPGPKMTSFPDQNVTDKGCFPLTAPGIQGPWVHNSSDVTKVPDHLQWGCIPSSGSNYTLEVDPADGWVSLNFIATQSNKQVDFSIDEHTMWLYEVDGAYVEPREFVAAAISSGERFSVMVKLDKTPARYTIRLPDSGATQVLSGFAEMVYKGGEHSTRPSIPYVTYGGMSALPITDTMSYTPYDLSSDTMTPWPPVAPAPVADEEFLLVMGRAGSSIKYTMNARYLYPPDFKADRPMLFYPNDTLGTEDENLVIRTRNGSWVDLILQVASLPGDEMAFQHVMHKHGSKTWRIGSGVGPWNYSSVAEAVEAEPGSFNLVNPGYRDTWMTVFATEPTGGYWTVYRYQVTDPGPWMFHCHFELHMMGGMSMAILDGVDAWPEVPPEYQLTKPSSDNRWKNILKWLRDLLDRLKGAGHSKA
ncbi:multicopper oxidase [Thermothelomyces heterothallicus CBS 202.75]|uniref:multicopper oxidase n=1 Tax=Thermothelomyces heterothallicus CBS 202.75 TaxID=1149848 RepID=UPI00374477AB